MIRQLNLFLWTDTSSPTNTVKPNISTFASSLPRQPRPTPPNTLNLTTFNEPLSDGKRDRISPSEKLSHKLISPNLVQSVRCSSPVVHNVESNVLSPIRDTRSFDASKNGALDTPKSMSTVGFSRSSGKFTSAASFHQNNLSATSPVMPDVRNILAENHGLVQNVKTPPPPPPRWAKPGMNQNQSNFTVTTTVTFNVDGNDMTSSSQVRQKLLRKMCVCSFDSKKNLDLLEDFFQLLGLYIFHYWNTFLSTAKHAVGG